MEFAQEKEIMFTRWCQTQKVETLNQLRELILIETFKNCVRTVSTYLNEQKAPTLGDATILADEFVLTHRVFFLLVEGQVIRVKGPFEIDGHLQ